MIEEDARIGAGSVIEAHVVICKRARIGARVQVGPHCVLGGPPQDISFEGDDTWIEIGDDCRFFEGVTVHRSTSPGGPTRIGSKCFLMAYAHVAHDCHVGDDVVMANNAFLAGHVTIDDRANLGGYAGIQQFVRVGRQAMVGGTSTVRKDILPFSLADGRPALHYGPNRVGLKRSGLGPDRRRSIARAFVQMRTAAGRASLEPSTPELEHLVDWLAVPSKRGLSPFKKRS